ncbi:MAG TPA: hypothetical protein DCR63_03315 [Microbacterium sp.]|nr:hypothetical protein [Microbacterium sp.]
MRLGAKRVSRPPGSGESGDGGARFSRRAPARNRAAARRRTTPVRRRSARTPCPRATPENGAADARPDRRAPRTRSRDSCDSQIDSRSSPVNRLGYRQTADQDCTRKLLTHETPAVDYGGGGPRWPSKPGGAQGGADEDGQAHCGRAARTRRREEDRGVLPAQQARIDRRARPGPVDVKVVAVYSTKGGVGKTTAAVNLAWEASKEFRVLLWDLDPQGAAGFLLQVKPKKVKGGVGALVAGQSRVSRAIRSSEYDNLDVLPADASYRDLDLVFDHAKKSEQRISKILEQIDREYDVVILDCPPGAALVAENAVFSAHAVVVPLVPSPLSMRSLDQVTEFVSASVSKARVVAFLSMVDRRKTVHRDAVKNLPGGQTPVSRVVVPATVQIERMGTERAPIGSYAPTTEAARAYGELWTLVAKVVKPRARKRKH